MNGRTIEERRDSAVEIYEKRIKEGFYKNDDYAEIKKLMLKIFNDKYYRVEISNTKKIDFILWALGKHSDKVLEW